MLFLRMVHAVKLNFDTLSSGCWLFMTEFKELINFNIIVFPELLAPFMMVRGFISIAASSIGPKLIMDSFNIFSIPLCSMAVLINPDCRFLLWLFSP